MKFLVRSIWLVVGVLFLLNLLIRVTGTVVWDDAYFFHRYAVNLWETGFWSWNPGGDPAYGLTSPAHGGWTAAWSLLGLAPALSLWLASLAAGLGALWAIVRLVQRHAMVPAYRWEGWAYLGISLGLVVPQLASHATSGMDTCLGLLYLGAYLGFYFRIEKLRSPFKALILGMAGGAAFFVRPELLLFTGALPLAAVILHREKELRRQAFLLLFFTGFSALLCGFLAQTFLGSFLPLSFKVKSGLIYGEALTRKYRLVAVQEFAQFVLYNSLPIGVLGLTATLHFREWWKSLKPSEVGLLLALLVFLAYQVLFVLPIMGMSQRLLFPAWPVLLYLGARALQVRLQNRPWKGLASRSTATWPLPLLLAGLVLGASFIQRPPDIRKRWGKFSTEQVYHLIGENNWPLLADLAVYDGQMTFAATELGILGTMVPKSQVVDLSGLQNPEMNGGLNLDWLFEKGKPDFIYLPHPDYEEMLKAMESDPRFLRDYQYVDAESAQSWLGIALRKDYPNSEEIAARFFRFE